MYSGFLRNHIRIDAAAEKHFIRVTHKHQRYIKKSHNTKSTQNNLNKRQKIPSHQCPFNKSSLAPIKTDRTQAPENSQVRHGNIKDTELSTTCGGYHRSNADPLGASRPQTPRQ